MREKFMMYMIGRSGSGKTTIAEALEKRLKETGMRKLQWIDGDVIRQQFGGIFGYTKEERLKCNQAVRVVVQYLLAHDISVILTQVAPYEEIRNLVRSQFREEYIEVYIRCSYAECAKRDVKGYYRKQKEGKMENLNGADDVYEIPSDSEIVIDSEKESVSEAVDKILAYLEAGEYGISIHNGKQPVS